MSVNPGSLSWPEDVGYARAPRNQPVDPIQAMQEAYVEAQANLALAGAKRNRYGTLPGRDKAICEQLNADIAQAQAECDAAREALQAQPKVETRPAFGAPLVE